MTLLGDWGKAERYARLGKLGGYQCKEGAPPVEWKRGMPKLTPTQQNELLADYAANMPTREIAAKYGVVKSYVSKLVARRGLPMRDNDFVRINKAQAAQKRKLK